MAKKTKKPEPKITDVYIESDGGEDGVDARYTMFYTNLNGQKQSMPLESDDYRSAKFEAASYHQIPESEVGDA